MSLVRLFGIVGFSALSACSPNAPLEIDRVNTNVTLTSDGKVRANVHTSASQRRTNPYGTSGRYNQSASGLTATQKREICGGQPHIRQIECVKNLG